jgi:hypothetical protein
MANNDKLRSVLSVYPAPWRITKTNGDGRVETARGDSLIYFDSDNIEDAEFHELVTQAVNELAVRLEAEGRK